MIDGTLDSRVVGKAPSPWGRAGGGGGLVGRALGFGRRDRRRRSRLHDRDHDRRHRSCSHRSRRRRRPRQLTRLGLWSLRGRVPCTQPRRPLHSSQTESDAALDDAAPISDDTVFSPPIGSARFASGSGPSAPQTEGAAGRLRPRTQSRSHERLRTNIVRSGPNPRSCLDARTLGPRTLASTKQRVCRVQPDLRVLLAMVPSCSSCSPSPKMLGFVRSTRSICAYGALRALHFCADWQAHSHSPVDHASSRATSALRTS